MLISKLERRPEKLNSASFEWRPGKVRTNDALQQQNQLGVPQFILASFKKSTLVSFKSQAEFSTGDAETKPPSLAGRRCRVDFTRALLLPRRCIIFEISKTPTNNNAAAQLNNDEAKYPAESSAKMNNVQPSNSNTTLWSDCKQDAWPSNKSNRMFLAAVAYFVLVDCGCNKNGHCSSN